MTQADLDAGTVTNNATATARRPAARSPGHRQRDRHATQSPALTLDKTIDRGEPYTTVGQLVPYSYVVTNTGNVTLDGPSPSPTTTSTRHRVCPATTLAPAASTTCTAVHTVTQADLDAGRQPTNAVDRRPPAGGATGHRHAEPSRPPRARPLTLDKTITSGDPYTTVGGTITYSYLVTNTGNVTITASPSATTTSTPRPSATSTTLAPTETTTCTAVHTVTQADLDAGTVTNNATADGTPAGGTLTPATDSATATATQTPALTLVKSADPADVRRGRRRHHLQLPRHQHRQRHPHRSASPSPTTRRP